MNQAALDVEAGRRLFVIRELLRGNTVEQAIISLQNWTEKAPDAKTEDVATKKLSSEDPNEFGLRVCILVQTMNGLSDKKTFKKLEKILGVGVIRREYFDFWFDRIKKGNLDLERNVGPSATMTTTKTKSPPKPTGPLPSLQIPKSAPKAQKSVLNTSPLALTDAMKGIKTVAVEKAEGEETDPVDIAPFDGSEPTKEDDSDAGKEVTDLDKTCKKVDDKSLAVPVKDNNVDANGETDPVDNSLKIDEPEKTSEKMEFNEKPEAVQRHADEDTKREKSGEIDSSDLETNKSAARGQNELKEEFGVKKDGEENWFESLKKSEKKAGEDTKKVNEYNALKQATEETIKEKSDGDARSEKVEAPKNDQDEWDSMCAENEKIAADKTAELKKLKASKEATD